MNIKFTTVVPVYKNADSIPRLLSALAEIADNLNQQMEVVFVVDGSPDRSFQLLQQALEEVNYPAQVLVHSRNFGSFAAVRTGLAAATGEYFCTMAADLQEPPELLPQVFEELQSEACDVVIAVRETRDDGFFSMLTSKLFWWGYRRFVVPEMPRGGVDVFGCNRQFRDQLLQLEESHSSLVSLIFWLGFRRREVSYVRLKREEGISSWTFRKKLRYMSDSIFAFTDLPIRALTLIGLLGTIVSAGLGCLVLVASLTGNIEVSGYAATMLTILSLGSLNLLGLGLVGNYAWRAYENSKQRPQAIVSIKQQNNHYE
ncbi:MAG: glycosyltransferase family 2 protein [Gammaproteobacteria bacterium]|nr:glycosyltransferase family 2 protein [Gammaproteobacteria bacterium]